MSDKNIKAFDNADFLHSREARTIRIISEYIEPEKRFNEYNIQHTVVFFGSARLTEDTEDTNHKSNSYQVAEHFAFELAKMSKEIENETGDYFYICTGGGPGIMEAANKGASRAGARTIGLNIELPFEQNPNQYISPNLNFEFHYFFMRKLWFLYHAKAIIVFPGGFGTLDELFETLTLVQTKKLEKFSLPILLYDKNFWDGLINFQKLVDTKLISAEDLNLFQYFSTVEEALEILRPLLISNMKNIHHYDEIKFPI